MISTHDNIIVNSLWIGDALSTVELLTIYSFMDKGHPFRLWLYSPLKTTLPEEVEICDANLIIPEEKVFAYRDKNKYGHGKGSVAGFSDIFRYKLLYDRGGWWVDMDVTCLRRLDFAVPYYFRQHHDLLLVGNVIKCPAQSPLMLRCYEEAIHTIDENNTDWHKPIDILNRHVVSLGLEGYIRSGHSNIDRWEETNRFILTARLLPSDWYFIHWQNEEWKFRRMSRSFFYYKSAIAKLSARYHLYKMPSTVFQKSTNTIRNSYSYIKNGLTYVQAKLGFQ
jgi:hypothetical protein